MAGLHNICEVLGAMTQSLIGSTNSIKCVTDGEETAFVNCVDQLLQNIQIQNKIADIIVSAVSSHHRNYRCSCKTLLTLILAWTKVIGNLKKQDVPLSVILRSFHQAVMFCVDHAGDISVKIKDIQKSSKQCQMESVNSSVNSNSKMCEATELERLLKQGSVALGQNIKEDPVDVKDLGYFHAVIENGNDCRPQLSLSPNNGLKSLTAVRQNMDDCDNCNADDDVSWYFEAEGVMPSDAITKDESGVNLGLHNNSFNGQDLGIESYCATKLNQVPNHCTVEPKVTQRMGQVSSLQDFVNDDVFDSCFDEDFKPESLDDFKLKTGSCIMMKKKETFSKNGVADGCYKIGEDDDDDDEFGSCFKESSSSNVPLHMLTTNSVKIPDSLTSFHEHKKSESAYNEIEMSTTAVDPVSVGLFMENRLQEVLKKSHKEDLKMRVFNRCRHLTTLQSTVSELQQSVKHEHEQSKYSVNQRMNSDPQQGMMHPQREIVNSSHALDRQSTQALDELQSPAGVQLRHLLNDSRKQSECDKHLKNIKVEASDIVSETQNDAVDYKAVTISGSKYVSCLSHMYNEKDDVGNREMERDGRPSLLWNLTKMLSHGAEEVVPLVANVCWNQMKGKKTSLLSSIKLSSIHTHTVVGPVWEHSSIVDGAVLNTTAAQLTVLSRLSGPYRVLLIHGDLQHSYKHKGQQVKQDQVTIRKQPMAESKEAVWLKDLQSIIKKLSVQVLLLSGIAADSVLDLCDNMDVLLLTKLPYSLMVMLGEACQVDYVKYVTEATEDNVLYPLMVDPYSGEWRDKIAASSNSQLVVIRTSTALLQTCVLCHPCKNVIMLREEQFWHCVRRLASCIHSNKMLPGGGATELNCAIQLRRQADKLETNGSTSMPYHALIYCAVAEGFEQFTSIVSRNKIPDTKTDLTAAKLINSQGIMTEVAENTDRECEVFDDFESKIEAWQTACHVTCQLLLADMEITTGLEIMHRKIII